MIYCRKQGTVRGSVRSLDGYFEADCERFNQIRLRLKRRWLLYLSALEAEIVEEKLDTVISSITFKYSR